MNTTGIECNEVQAILPQQKCFKVPYLIDSKQTDLFYLSNNNQMHAAITNYGARIVSLLVPGKNNQLVDVIVGPGNIDRFRSSRERYFGATIGRYGNRIANGRFCLDNHEYILSKNENNTTLHGGVKGFQDVVWNAVLEDKSTLRLSYLSKDNEEGFPGNLFVQVVFTLTDCNELNIGYEAVCDKRTILNLTNHAFFNLNGHNGSSILNHSLQINAGTYTPVDNDLIPLGTIDSVVDTAFDFRNLTRLGSIIEKFKIEGYDNNFVLTNRAEHLDWAVKVVSPETGILMEISTKEPCLLFYSGKGMKGENVLKNNIRDLYSTAFVLETHQFPDAPNHASFPVNVLNAGEIFRTRTVYRFGS